MGDRIDVIVSIDTEEDNWQPARERLTVENIRELPRLEAFFARLGIRATYFTTYQVAICPWAAEILRDIHESGRGEIGAHLHPWNTPPEDEVLVPHNTMLSNLPAALQHAKLERLTAALTEGIGVPPRAFRAGRFGFGPATATALLQCGYHVDSSVTPFFSWSRFDGGPTFVGAPLNVYRLASDSDVRVPAESGALWEVPVSCGYSRRPFTLWSRVHAVLDAPPLRPLRVTGVASRAGLIKKIMLNPETETVADMLSLSRQLLDQGLRFLQLFWHSPSLRPGLSPHVPTAAGVERLYASIEAYLDGLSRLAPLRFIAISEAAPVLASRDVA